MAEPRSRPASLPSPRALLECAPCAARLVHELMTTPTGCAWTCTACGAVARRFTHDEMRQAIEAYTRPLAPKSAPPLEDVEGLEVDVLPKLGGECITYTGPEIRRHIAAGGRPPAVGDTFWGHFPWLPPHIAKFDLGQIVEVRRGDPAAA